MEGTQRKLAAILIADAVGYSRLMGEDEEAALEALKASRAIIEPLIAEYGGRVFGGAGDSVVAEFPSAVGALGSAVAMQRRLAAAERSGAGHQALKFRIGINVGDVIIDGDNLYGDGVNVTERLQGLAEPGGICISGTVHDQVRDRFPAAFLDLGEQRVKNISHPVRAFRVDAAQDRSTSAVAKGVRWRRRLVPLVAAAVVALALVAAALYGWLAEIGRPSLSESKPPEAVEEESGPPIIAVLPFTNLSGDPGQDYFSDGLTEDIISALGRFSNISVISRNAVFRLKGQPVNIGEIRDTLKARYLLEGSVRKSGERLRVAAQLTDTMQNLLIWSAQFDSRLRHLRSAGRDHPQHRRHAGHPHIPH